MELLLLRSRNSALASMSRLVSGTGTMDHNAFAQITARCSRQVEHAYAIYLWIESERVKDARYTRGSMKFSSGSGADMVEQAVACFCSSMVGHVISEVESLSPEGLVQGCTHLAVEGVSWSVHRELVQGVKGNESEPFRTLQTAGMLPFILFNWAWINYQLKRVVAEVTGTHPGGMVRLHKPSDVARLLIRLAHMPAFALQGRGLEIGIRSLDMSTVDESSLRSAYQRASLETLQALGRHRGFADEFRSNS